jgi:MFS family permease
MPAGSLWALPNFRRLWLAGLVSQVGDRVHQVALLWWAIEQTHSPAVAGTLLMVSTLPIVLFSPVAGWLADHWGRRPVMILADAWRLILAGIMAWMAWQGMLTITTAVVLSALVAIGAALFNPASMAIVPDVVDEPLLPQANSWQELTAQVTGIVGPALGGLVVALIGAGTSFAVNAGSFLLSALLLAAMRQHAASPQAAEPFWESQRQILAFLRQRPDIGWLLASFGLWNFFGVPVLVYTPYFANEVFRTGATGYGLLEAAPPLGMALAALWIGRRGEPGSIAQVYPICVLVQALSYVGMGLWPTMGGFLAALSLVGIAIGLVNVIVISHFQRVVPVEQLGRFMGLLMTVIMAMVPLSFGLSGLLTRSLVPEHVLLACGMAMVGMALAVRRIPTAST